MESIFDRITIPSAGYGATNGSAAVGNAPAIVGSTGLVASVEAAEFERIVKDAIDPVVLCMLTGNTPAPNPRVPQRISRRYAMSCSGIVFVTQSVRPLQFAADVRAVECQAIVFDNKPLG